METLESSRRRQHLREVLLHHFFSKKSAAEAHRLLVEVYGDHALSNSQCSEWFQRFKHGDFDIHDKERSGQPKKFEDTELLALLDEDPCRTQGELAKALNVTQAAVSQRLRALGMVQAKAGKK